MGDGELTGGRGRCVVTKVVGAGVGGGAEWGLIIESGRRTDGGRVKLQRMVVL